MGLFLSLCVPLPESLEEQPSFELQVQESVMVQEGLCVHVPCSFSYPWSSSSSSTELHTYWFSKEDSVWYDSPVASRDPNRPAKTATQGRFLLMDATNNNCSLQIRDARRSDTGTYMFRMERGSVKYSYQDKMLKLQVTGKEEAPERTLRCGTRSWNKNQTLGHSLIQALGPGWSEETGSW